MIQFVIVDQTGRPAAELLAAAAALTKQSASFSLPQPWGWGQAWTVRVASAVAPVMPMECPVYLLEVPDAPGALGYHDRTPQGGPLVKVFPALDAVDGVPWTVTASHELAEATVNPLLRRAVQGADGKFRAHEVSDAVEQDTYKIDGVAVSNYVLPAYFEPLSGAQLKLDYMGLVKAPLELRPGGYEQVWDPASQSWSQNVNGQKRPARATMDAMGLSRGARRSALAA